MSELTYTNRNGYQIPNIVMDSWKKLAPKSKLSKKIRFIGELCWNAYTRSAQLLFLFADEHSDKRRESIFLFAIDDFFGVEFVGEGK